MKFNIVPTTKFKKDLKHAIKRGYDMSLLDEVIEALINGRILSEKYHDHALSGNFAGYCFNNPFGGKHFCCPLAQWYGRIHFIQTGMVF